MNTTKHSSGFAMLLFCLCIIIACKEKTTYQVAKLLDRNEKIMNGKEWDFVQNYYVSLRNKIQKNPADDESQIKLAQLFIQEARVTGEHGHYYPAALAVLNHALALPKIKADNKFNALVTKAGVQLSLHDFSNALATGKEATKINPYNAQLYGVLVDANVELGNYKEAIGYADQMMKIRPDLRSYSRVSYLREIHGDVDGAKEAMLMAINAGYPGYEETAWAMHTYGDMLIRYNELNQAEQVYNTILKERENYPFAIAALAEIAIKKGDDVKGEKLLKQAIDVIPEVGYYITLAELYQKQERAIELEKTKTTILSMMSEDEAAGHNMDLEYAHVYQTLFHNNGKAMSYAQKELSKRPSNIDVNRTLAWLAAENDNKNEAKKFLAAASITNSKHPELTAISKSIN